MALYTLQKVRRDLEQRNATGDRVRIVSLSFDPVHDTPESCAPTAAGEAAAALAGALGFSDRALAAGPAPVLDGLGQDVGSPAESEAEKPANLTHMLKVFLIDRDGWVREIYSTAYLYPEVVIADIETLRLEGMSRDAAPSGRAAGARISR